MTNTDCYIDISVPVRAGMPHWPGDDPYTVTQLKDMSAGDGYNLSSIALSVHTGTHMDAPLHFVDRANAIDLMPVHATLGPARVIKIEDRESIRAEELSRHSIQAGERILFRTFNSARSWPRQGFLEDFVYISKEGAQFLAEKKILTVGVDYLSVGGYAKDGPETHQALLGAGIWVIEGLDLSQAPAGRYELICLPLKLEGAEGAPARAVLRKEVSQ